MRRAFAFLLPVLVMTMAIVARPVQPAYALAATYAAGWNLVSGPSGSQVVGAAGPLYTLQPGDSTYEVVPAGTPLRACVGYWAYFPSGGGLDAVAAPASPCTLDIPAGQWAMTGNPALNGRATVNGATAAFVYSGGGYQAASAVEAGQGIWVSGPGTVTVTPPGTGSSTSGAPTADPGAVPCADGTSAPSADGCQGHGGPAQPAGDCTIVRNGVVIHLHC